MHVLSPAIHLLWLLHSHMCPFFNARLRETFIALMITVTRVSSGYNKTKSGIDLQASGGWELEILPWMSHSGYLAEGLHYSSVARVLVMVMVMVVWRRELLWEMRYRGIESPVGDTEWPVLFLCTSSFGRITLAILKLFAVHDDLVSMVLRSSIVVSR